MKTLLTILASIAIGFSAIVFVSWLFLVGFNLVKIYYDAWKANKKR